MTDPCKHRQEYQVSENTFQNESSEEPTEQTGLPKPQSTVAQDLVDVCPVLRFINRCGKTNHQELSIGLFLQLLLKYSIYGVSNYLLAWLGLAIAMKTLGHQLKA